MKKRAREENNERVLRRCSPSRPAPGLVFSIVRPLFRSLPTIWEPEQATSTAVRNQEMNVDARPQA